MINSHRATVKTLIEALPYLQAFRGETVVIKYGGAAMEKGNIVKAVLRDVVFLEAAGINPVIVHGGGKAISRAMEEVALEPKFIDGLRVTDQQTIQIMDRVFSEKISPDIVEQIEELGGRAKQLSGKEIFRAEKIDHRHSKTGELVDFGFTGGITEVLTDKVFEIIHEERVPVISPEGADAQGQLYNINADVAASQLAKALKAKKIIFLSDVSGLLRDPKNADTRIPFVSHAEIEALKKEGVIDGGMNPKVNSAISALQGGVGQVHLLDGSMLHSILLEIFTDAGVGTEVTL